MASESPTATLIHTAFTPQSTLYTILECKPSSTSAELKRAYRQAALRYHPDRQQQQQKKGGVSSTLKFQAVSAAYQILMDDKRRSAYDSTGRILEEEDESYYYAGNRNEMGGGKARAQPPQKQWEQVRYLYVYFHLPSLLNVHFHAFRSSLTHITTLSAPWPITYTKLSSSNPSSMK
ncbi:hypothetical protein ACHAXR_011926 [Thalassiosira sp. AJA248-18]